MKNLKLKILIISIFILMDATSANAQYSLEFLKAQNSSSSSTCTRGMGPCVSTSFGESPQSSKPPARSINDLSQLMRPNQNTYPTSSGKWSEFYLDHPKDEDLWQFNFIDVSSSLWNTSGGQSMQGYMYTIIVTAKKTDCSEFISMGKFDPNVNNNPQRNQPGWSWSAYPEIGKIPANLGNATRIPDGNLTSFELTNFCCIEISNVQSKWFKVEGSYKSPTRTDFNYFEILDTMPEAKYGRKARYYINRAYNQLQASLINYYGCCCAVPVDTCSKDKIIFTSLKDFSCFCYLDSLTAATKNNGKDWVFCSQLVDSTRRQETFSYTCKIVTEWSCTFRGTKCGCQPCCNKVRSMTVNDWPCNENVYGTILGYNLPYPSAGECPPGSCTGGCDALPIAECYNWKELKNYE
jgi:hypothetical protein